MNSPKLIRWGSWGALLGGTAWMVSGFFFYVFAGEGDGPEGSLSWYLIESADAVAETGMLVALVGLHVRQTPNYGWLGAAGFVLAFVGTAFVLLSTVIWLLAGEENYFVGLFFALGLFVGWPVGFTLLGVATLRAKVFPRWCGVLLVAFFPIHIRHLLRIRHGSYMERPRVAGAGLCAPVGEGHIGWATPCQGDDPDRARLGVSRW